MVALLRCLCVSMYMRKEASKDVEDDSSELSDVAETRVAGGLSCLATTIIVVGILMAAGVFVTVSVPSSGGLSPFPPPAPRPPLSPPAPRAPDGTIVLRSSTCAVTVSGIVLSRVNNYICDDGGDGADNDMCVLGSDFPDCPERYDPVSV